MGDALRYNSEPLDYREDKKYNALGIKMCKVHGEEDGTLNGRSNTVDLDRQR
jgi:hypothetical protein